MAITAKDIAELVGVSRQAVSAVLNGNPGKVSAEKRRKIFHLAKNMQYRPNPAALRLAGHAPEKFAVIDIGLFPPVKLSVLQNLTLLLAERGFQVRLTPPGDKKHKIKMMYDSAHEGASVVFTDMKADLFDTEHFPVPLVIFGNASERCDITWDYAGGMEKLIRHLTDEHCHKRIGIICGGENSASCGKELLKEWYMLLMKNHLEYDSSWHIPMSHCQHPVDMVETLIREDHVTAFICETDAAAAKLMIDLKLRGISVPQDVAIIGNGTSFITELTAVPLTSIYLPAAKYAECAVKIAMKKIENNYGFPEEPEKIPLGLFLGGSCGCKAAELPQLYWEAVPLSLEDQSEEIRESNRYEFFKKYLLK